MPERTFVIDEENYNILVERANQLGVDVQVLANAAIKAANMMFSDSGLQYSQKDTFFPTPLPLAETVRDELMPGNQSNKDFPGEFHLLR